MYSVLCYVCMYIYIYIYTLSECGRPAAPSPAIASLVAPGRPRVYTRSLSNRSPLSEVHKQGHMTTGPCVET